MAIICWGNLAKSADSTERVEQAIEAYVESHNENANAHQIEGSSLYMHRVLEKLDHEFGSVSLEFLPKDQKYSMSMFESLDGWTKHGSCYAGIFGAMIISNGGVGLDEGWMTASPYTGLPALDFTKNPFFQTTVRLTTTTDQIAYFGTSTQFTEVERDGFGFEIVNATLYAFWRNNGTIHEVEITGISINDFNCYRAYIDSTAGEMYFYVNGVLKYTATTLLPEVESPVYFQYYIKQTGASQRKLYPIDFTFQQDR